MINSVVVFDITLELFSLEVIHFCTISLTYFKKQKYSDLVLFNIKFTQLTCSFPAPQLPDVIHLRVWDHACHSETISEMDK